jgi:2-keto-4-pentenoate hydratase/2-oxohepta-3-ene-1,7-dioic acid hydratase in catechol pathway
MDKIICIGKNYAEHAKELGDAIPENPVVFLKPPSIAAFLKPDQKIIEVELPRDRGAIHYECEIVLKLNADASISALTLGLDMTLREEQAVLKKNGHPWERY